MKSSSFTHLPTAQLCCNKKYKLNLSKFTSRSSQDCASAADEDFFIEVSPGTYAITAGLPESQQQTQLVSVKAGESVNLTFNL